MKCPKCGCESFAKILYGTPAFDDDFRLPASLQTRLDNKEIILGGCCIHPNSPKYMCLDCHFKYGSQPFFIKDDADHWKKENYLDLCQAVTWFEFSVGYWHKEVRIVLEKTDAQAYAAVIPPVHSVQKEQINNIPDSEWDSFMDLLFSDFLRYTHNYNQKSALSRVDDKLKSVLCEYGLSKTISENEWNDILSMLFSEYLIHEWDERFDNPNVLDGISWSIQYEFEYKNRLICGSNKYPPYWKQYITYLIKLTAFSAYKTQYLSIFQL